MNYCRNCGSASDGLAACQCGVDPNAGRNFCDSCGNPTYADETECPNCQCALESGQPSFKSSIVASNPPKDPTMIAALSVIPLPWLGHVFLGQTGKGMSMMLLTLILSFTLIGLILVPLAVIDGYKLAKALKEGRSIGPWDFYWSLSETETA